MFSLVAALHIKLGAEYTFASVMLLPVMLISWYCGLASGVTAAFLAAGIWLAADFYDPTHGRIDVEWRQMVNTGTRLVVYLLVALLTAKVRMLLDREAFLARQDALTGLLNRRAFMECGARETERSKRYGHSLSIIFIDLDNFKQLNDTKGHDTGDAALAQAADTLLNALRNTDLIGRIGGDEFVALLPETGCDEATMIGGKLREALNTAMSGFPPVSASVGVACFKRVEMAFPAMLQTADAVMYEIKAGGKDGIRVREYN